MNIPEDGIIKIIIEKDSAKTRIDTVLFKYFPSFSRSFFQKLIKIAKVKVNDLSIKSNYIVKDKDIIEIIFPEKLIPINRTSQALNINIEIIFEHQDFIIINKPAGIASHAPHQNYLELTVVDWLRSKFKNIDTVGEINRPGIVHRLDRNTSGLMIITLSPIGHATIGRMFKAKLIYKEYLALVEGQIIKQGEINYPLMRDPKNPYKRMALKDSFVYGDAKEAYTSFKVLNYFLNYSLVLVAPKTGRTHQIRVHLASIGHPLVGDVIYGALDNALISRHALHASVLKFNYLGIDYNFELALPADMSALIIKA